MKKNVLLCFVMATLLCCLSVSVLADEEAFLSFEEAVVLALKQNVNLQSGQDRVTSAKISVETAKSDFRVKVRPEISGLYQQSDELDQNYGVQFSKQLSYGGEVSWQAGTSVNDSLDDEYRTDLILAYRQPLLRGRGTLVTTNKLSTAEQNSRSQYRSLLLSRLRLIVQVAASYYGIIRDQMLIDVNERSVERAKLLYQAAEAKLKVGMASKMDVFRAELQALSAENNLVDAHASLGHAKRRFNLLLGADMVAEYLFPSTLRYSPIRLDKERLIQEALENRLEIQEAHERIEEAERLLKIAKQNLLPPLDVSVRYTVRGEGDAFEESLDMDDEF
ncbi:MAG: TolC family protein, partial [bacterium]|nr:TolC family protein [bacterium]